MEKGRLGGKGNAGSLLKKPFSVCRMSSSGSGCGDVRNRMNVYKTDCTPQSGQAAYFLQNEG